MSIRDDALYNDKIIEDIVVYEVTRGTTRNLKKEDLITIQDRFAEYKGLIKRGEFTIRELEDKVFSKYGVLGDPIPPPLPKLPPIQEIKPINSQEELDKFLKEIKSIVKKEREINKPYKWYHLLRDRIKLCFVPF